MRSVQLYDTTLRDGAQREGISFSVEDKLKIAHKLDELGIHFIEGGWPGSNPKDSEFFSRARNLRLRNAALVAFGSTKRHNAKPQDDRNLKALIESGVKIATIVGKSSRMQVSEVLEVSLKTNLQMIRESILYLRDKGMRVFFDAEHYFDGYRVDPEYSLSTLRVAAEAGAECAVLCDTNGGSLTHEVADWVRVACRNIKTAIGIHSHNDTDLAVANSLAAIEAGAVQVQGTINGYGERCGNANLCSIIPVLKLKMGINCISNERLAALTETAHYVAGVANLSHDRHMPFVGSSAFTHKGGLHVSGLLKNTASYHHINPETVGNTHRVVVSELAGKGNIIYKARELGVRLAPKGEETHRLLDQIKLLESRGFLYEDADASFELLLRRSQHGYKPPFMLVDFMVVVERHRRMPTANTHEETLAEATVKLRVGSKIFHTAAEGNGPVNALDAAMRKALVEFYPKVAVVKLVDYKVRILEEDSGTASQVRVMIESSDGNNTWRTVGGSSNIIEASWLALADSLEYWLTKCNTG